MGLALLVEGKVVLGVMACPNLPMDSAVCEKDKSSQENVGCLFFATTGSGTFMQPLKGNSLPQKVSFTYLKLNHVINLQLFDSVKESKARYVDRCE